MHYLIIAFTLLAYVCAPTALAQATGIYVEIWRPATGNPCNTNPPAFGDGWFAVPGFPSRGANCPGAVPQQGLSSGSNISFVANAGGNYRIYAVDSSATIGTVNVSGSGYTLLIGRATTTTPPFTDPNNVLPTAGASSIVRIDAVGGTLQIRSAGSVGPVTCASVVRIDARQSIGTVSASGAIGVIRAPAISDLIFGSSVSQVRAENWNSGNSPSDITASISASSGNITQVIAPFSRISGNITSNFGTITTVESGIGIGSTSSTPTIQARTGIGTIKAPSINANIIANRDNGTGDLGYVEATTGDLSGTVAAADLESTQTFRGIFVGGQLDANLTFASIKSPINVSGRFVSGRSLTIGAGGIQSQVVFNRATSFPGAFLGTATVGGIALSPLPAYSQLPSALGGGSIGAVPFSLHSQASNPPNRAFVPGTVPPHLPNPTSLDDMTASDFRGIVPGSARRNISLEFYGPVKLPSSGAPVQIILESVDCTSQFDYTSLFQFSVDPASPRRLLIERKPQTTPFLFIIPGSYTVSLPATGGLQCDLGAGNPSPTVAPFFFNFRLYNDCDNDGTPFPAGNTSLAFEAFCGATGYCDPIDFNGDGLYPADEDVLDFLRVLAGGVCSTGTCNDIDFNNDGLFPTENDLLAFLDVLAGGGCEYCWLN